MTPPVPSALVNTPWESWLDEFPDMEASPTLQDFQEKLVEWLDEAPGDNARPNDIERLSLALWFAQIDAELLNRKIGDVELPRGPLKFAFTSIVGALASAAATAFLGSAAAGFAAAFISVGLAFTGFFFVFQAFNTAARTKKRNRLLEGMRRRITKIGRRYW